MFYSLKTVNKLSNPIFRTCLDKQEKFRKIKVNFLTLKNIKFNFQVPVIFFEKKASVKRGSTAAIIIKENLFFKKSLVYVLQVCLN